MGRSKVTVDVSAMNDYYPVKLDAGGTFNAGYTIMQYHRLLDLKIVEGA